MRGEGRNVSRPVEFSAARPLLADKAGRAKSGLQAASPESTPQARSPQPRAPSPRVADAALPFPGEKRVSRRPRGQRRPWRACGKSKTKKDARLPPGRARLRGGAARWARDGGAGRGSASAVTAEALSSPSPCPRQPPPPSPGWQKFAKSGRPGCRAPRGARPVRLTSARAPTRPLAQPPLTSAPARSPARGSHRSQINKSACGRGWRACHGEGSQQSPPLLHGGRESP